MDKNNKGLFLGMVLGLMLLCASIIIVAKQPTIKQKILMNSASEALDYTEAIANWTEAENLTIPFNEDGDAIIFQTYQNIFANFQGNFSVYREENGKWIKIPVVKNMTLESGNRFLIIMENTDTFEEAQLSIAKAKG